jgi:hypothetical protein
MTTFVEGVHYRQLGREGGRYRFELLETVRVKLKWRVPAIKFLHRGVEWLRFENSHAIIPAGYRWNGCSPKRWVPVFGWVGTPDPPNSRLGSLVHDALYQFSPTKHFPLRRDQADEVFFDLMESSGFRWAGLYHGAVQDCGGAFWQKRDPELESELLPV